MKISKPLRRQTPPTYDPEVKQLQRELKALGFKVAIDGRPGEDTESAIKEAQEAFHPAGEPPFPERGVVDERLAALINSYFADTPVGKIVGNRETMFKNKNDALAELDAALRAEKAKPNPDRLTLDGLYERKHTWLARKEDELKKGIWDGLPGYAYVVRPEQEFYAQNGAMLDKFAALLTSAVDQFAPLPKTNSAQQTPLPVAQSLMGKGLQEEGFPGLIYISDEEGTRRANDVALQAVANKREAIENLENWLLGNPGAPIDRRDDARNRLHIWRERLDQEVTTPGLAAPQAGEQAGPCEEDLAEFIAQFESTELNVYKDQAGKDTIGVGHLITDAEKASGKIRIGGQDVPYASGLTRDQTLELFRQDLARYERAVDEQIAGKGLTRCQRIALISLCYNIGIGGFRRSSALDKIREGKLDEVPDEIRKYNKVTNPDTGEKEESRGLTRRRGAEANLWTKR